jgi:hypothetical protein
MTRRTRVEIALERPYIFWALVGFDTTLQQKIVSAEWKRGIRGFRSRRTAREQKQS